MKTFYAIRNKETKVLLSIEQYMEEEISFVDDSFDEIPWLTDVKERAVSAITEEVDSSDSTLQQPGNSWMFRDGKFQNYEVVEVTLEIANENLR